MEIKHQFIVGFSIFGILSIVLLAAGDWSRLNYDPSARSEAALVFLIAGLVSVAIPFSLGILVNTFHDGWARISYLLVCAGSIVGCYVFTTNGGSAGVEARFVWGAFVGAAISSAAIVVPYLIGRWVYSGFRPENTN